MTRRLKMIAVMVAVLLVAGLCVRAHGHCQADRPDAKIKVTSRMSTTLTYNCMNEMTGDELGEVTLDTFEHSTYIIKPYTITNRYADITCNFWVAGRDKPLVIDPFANAKPDVEDNCVEYHWIVDDQCFSVVRIVVDIPFSRQGYVDPTPCKYSWTK